MLLSINVVYGILLQMDLPELENPTSERIRSFVNYLIDSRPSGVMFLVIR